MTTAAAPVPGRRVTLGAAAVLVGFLLLAPPIYLLGPFALLTLVARPRTLRELFWLAAAGAGISAAMAGPAALGPLLIRVSGLTVGAVFFLLSLRAVGPVFPRAMAAVVVGGVGIAVWAWLRGLSFTGIETAFTDMLRTSYRALIEMGGTDPRSRSDIEAFVNPFIAKAPEIGRMMPGFLALEALAGSLLAWSWHHRISETPLGLPPGRFRDFRFNDHLVWGAIFTLGLLLAPMPSPVPAVAANLMVIWVGLYAMRGLAILAALLAPAPAPLRFFAAGLALLLIPVALGACLALGLADTWLDIRGRLTPPAPGGALP